MKSMKKTVICIMAALFVLFPGCGPQAGGDNSPGNGGNTGGNTGGTYGKDVWGAWIRMDTGDVWYISGNAITNAGTAVSGVVLSKQSNKVTEVTEGSRKYYLYAYRTATSTFTGRIANMGAAAASARALTGLGGIQITIDNLENAANEIVTTTEADGSFTAEGVIAGDSYKVTVEGQTTTVTPQVDGEDVGTITVTKGVNFKSGIKPASGYPVNMMLLGASETNIYHFTIEIENTGDEDCLAALYQLDFDGDLASVTQPASKSLGSIEPGAKKTIDVAFACKTITGASEFKKIGITIDDQINKKTWNDSVSLMFNKDPVNFYCRSDTLARGIIIAPGGEAYPIVTGNYYSGDNLSTFSLPMSNAAEDYIIAFSGATANTEAKYSFGAGVLPETDYPNFNDLGNYEPNNTEDAAIRVGMGDKVMSYLHKNDIDYYKIRFTGENDIAVSPSTVNAVRGATRQFSAGTSPVTWTLFGNYSPDTGISANGLLTIAADETSRRLTLRASSGAGTSGLAEVTVYSSFTSIQAVSDYLDSTPDNTQDTPYHIILSGLDLSTDFMGGEYANDGLGLLHDLFKKRYVVMDLSGCTGTSIPDCNFNSHYPSKVTSLILPDTITAIGDYAFTGCGALTSIVLPSSFTVIGKEAFSGCAFTSIVLPSSLTVIGDNAFNSCRALTSIVLPSSLTAIGDYVFAGCQSLTSINLEETRVFSIGQFAFNYCTSLVSVILPSSVASIGRCSFQGCTALMSITLPGSLSSIASDSFLESKQLTFHITGTGVFSTAANGKMLIRNGTEVFAMPSASGAVIIPEGITVIGEMSFYRTAITAVSLPNSLTTIKQSAFNICDKLERIDIPASVTAIEDLAIWGVLVIFRGTTVPSMNAGAISYSLTAVAVYVPDSSVAAYTNVLGPSLAEKIKPLSQLPQ